MPYWECVTRSFRIAWRHKYLWLIALFSGEGGFSFNYSQSTGRGGGTTGTEQIQAAQRAALDWLGAHVGLVVALGIIWLVLAVALFILGAVCEGATIRASAEHDAERPFGLGWAWRSGVATMWVVIRFRLLLLLLYLPLIAVVLGFVVSVFAAVTSNNSGLAGVIGLFAVLLLLAIPYAIYIFLLDRLGARAVVLEQLMARAGIVRGHRLLFKRFGRTLLVLLLSVAIAIGVGLLLACVLGLVLVPFVLVGVAIGSANSAAIAPLVIVGALLLLAISLLLGGFLAAQTSTYWTLAFRRLDVDYTPAAAYWQAPAGPQVPPAPPAPPPQPAQ